MCGIVGQVRRSGPVDPQHLEAACRLMRHRGPDSGGQWSSGEVQLGFRRLAILDLSAAGAQPMRTPDGRVALVFNGEIYNFRTLRSELQKTYAFQSDTDTEVILHGYRAWGWEGLLRRLDGMFAFALWDAETRTLYAARDRLGKKPFFYRHGPDGFSFASTLHALRALVPGKDRIDHQALDAYLTYQSVPAPMTLFEAFRQLPPAHALSYQVENGALAIERYWDLPFVPKLQKSEADVLDRLDELVRAAVVRRLASDVPLGAFLSGGVDSSLVVALMAQAQAMPVEAVVMGFQEASFDERPFARKVAERWGVRLHEHVLRPDAVSDLPEILWHYGQPLADVSIVPTYYVAKAAREHVTVVLNGDGGDEVFGGYARPVVARAAQAYRRLVPASVRRALHKKLGRAEGTDGWTKKARMLAEAGADTAAEAYVYDRGLRLYREEAYAPALLEALDGNHPDAHYQAAWTRAAGADDVDRALYGDLTTYLPDQLLTKMDVSTMAHGVEARAPLLDKELIEYAARIPTSMRLKGYATKPLLKKLAARYVPRDVLYRPKRGFVMPTATWLRGPLGPYVESALTSDRFNERGWIQPAFAEKMLREHQASTHDWSDRLWTLFVLELWAWMELDGTMERNDSLERLR